MYAIHWSPSFCLSIVVACLLGLTGTTRAAKPAVRPVDKIRVLLVTGGHGFQAKPFFAMFDTVPDLEVTHAAFPKAADLLVPASADRYDVVVLYDMWKGLTDAQQHSFVELLKRGIGVVALHHTLAAHPQWNEYMKIIGGRYRLGTAASNEQGSPKSEYYHDQEIDVEIADKDHPITRGIGNFHIHDETYRNFEVLPSVRVLLKTGHPKSNAQLAWVHQYGHSRVFYLQLGHDRHAYQHPAYRTLVARGIRWAAGLPTTENPPRQELFNGKNLSGWKIEGGAVWEVKDGVLIGRQGPNNAPGDLLTEQEFDDFELTVRYRVTWPANSGIWYRYQGPQKTYQADILEYKKPVAWSGSLYCPGKLFIAINDNPRIVHREGWNTMVIRTVANRHRLYLNGHQIADVRDDTSRSGRIGFQVHVGKQFGEMKIEISRVSITRL